MLFFLYFFLGKKKIRITSLFVERVISKIIKSGVNPKKLTRLDDNSAEFIIYANEADELESVLRGMNVQIETQKFTGLPAFFIKYRRRYGIYVGIVLSLAVLISSTQFVWRIDVTGNDKMTDSEILELLDEFGVGVGSYIPGIDVENIQHRIVAEDGRIAWLSINRVGSVINTELIERKKQDGIDGNPVNIVASRDGQIESIEVYDGTATVSVSESVRKGELLISGITDGNAYGLRKIAADGKVIARVNEKITVEIPFESTEKIYTGNKKEKNTFIFFGKNVNLYLNSRISMDKYDIMISRKNIHTWDGTVLPIGIETVSYREYEFCTVNYTQREALEKAIETVNSRVCELLTDGELLSRNQTVVFTELSCVIECDLYYLCNIAEKLPIS
ncbi:MAG: sporulation protein YqfD [Clostridia bacterium]|nr:sporulation protein YqfD [Clostridia bacterium]